jgi:hypothetical protein
MAEDDIQEQLQEDLEAPQVPGFKALRSPEGYTYYVPSEKPALTPPEVTVGTPLEPSEIPIPFVSQPREEVPAAKPKPVYDVLPAETVPETPNEQLEKLLPPVDANAELGALLPETPPEDRGFAEAATAPVRLGAAKFLEHPGNLVYGIPAALTGLLADIEESIPSEGRPISGRRTGGVADFRRDTTMRDVANWLKGAAEGTKKFAGAVTGTEGQKPATPLEKLGAWTGEYAFPTKGVSGTATVGLAAAGAAVRGGLTGFGPEDIPIPSLVTSAAAAEDPFAKAFGGAEKGRAPTQGPPVKVAPSPNAPTVPAAMPPASKVVGPRVKSTITPEVPEGMVIPPPDLRTTSPPNVKRRTRKGEFVESEEDFAKRFENAWVVKEIQARTYSPTAMEIFQSVAGMQRTSSTEYKAMGGVLATLIGMALFGKMYQKFHRAALPSPRSVQEAAPGTAAISVPADLARAYDDINAPLTRIARRAGVDPTVVSRLEQTFRIQTRNGARALADSAIELGRMETPSFRFQAPVALNDIARRSTPESNRYLKVLSTVDELLAKRVVGTQQPGAATVMVNGMTIKDALQAVKDIENMTPAVKDIAKANQAWNKAVRSFQKNGEYGTLTKDQLNELSMSHTNSLGGKFTDDAMVGQANEARRLIKQRLDNEAVGKYVDEMRKVDPSLFVKVTKEQLEANPTWKENVATFKRRGEREYYTTDPLLADVLRTDHHLITGWSGNAFYATKRLLETTTTGNLAPNFSVVSALRSYWIAKFTTEQGFKAPTAVGSIIAIPQQLVPQIARSISRGLENGSQGMLGQIFGQPWLEGLSKRLATVYDDSLYAQMKAAGSHRGSILEQQQRARGIQQASQAFNAAAAADPALRGAQHFWNAWKASIESIHNGPAFNFVKRNLGKEGAPELALRARRLTGDPRTGGEYYGPTGRPIRFESDNRMDQAIANTLVKGYGWTMENVGKNTIPWWNATLQGAKRIGEAYLHDPIRFTRSTALYAMAPAASMFYYAKALGDDPNGRSYLDYLLNGRSAYNRQMNFYVPIPGKPVEDGVEITFFHELNPFKRATEIALHHMLGSDMPKDNLLFAMPDNVTARRPLREDLWIAAHAFLDTAIIPPMPPIINTALGAFGIRGPQGVFGGQAFPVKGDPFNQNGGLPNSLEIASRALIGGVAESLAGFYAASANSEGNIINAVQNGLAQVKDIFVKKTPGLRDITRILPDISNNTDLAKEVFDHQKEFNDLSRFYKKWTVGEGRIGVTPASKGGEIAVTEQYGLQQLGPGNPGLQQPEPTNPLYIEFMQEYYNRFIKESPNMVKGEDQGGVGFKSLWRNYGRATQKIDRLKDVNQGTYERWQREMEPEARDELERNGVDTTDRREVVNFYRKMQFDALRVINYVRRATEDQLSRRAGKPVRLKDIPPFLEPGEAPFMYPDLIP